MGSSTCHSLVWVLDASRIGYVYVFYRFYPLCPTKCLCWLVLIWDSRCVGLKPSKGGDFLGL